METEKGFIDLIDGQLYFETAGVGRSIVLIHGMGLDTRMWDNQFERLSKQFRVIRYDVRGYGLSTCPTTLSYTHQNDLKQLLDLLGIERTIIIGLSMGGDIAIKFSLEYPEAVDSLILANSGLEGYISQRTNNDLGTIYQEIERSVSENHLDKARGLWLGLPHFSNILKNKEVSDMLYKMTDTYTFWHFANDNPIIRSQVKAKDRLKEINKPCLIISGELDLIEFRDIAETLNNELAVCTHKIISNAGHLSNMEEPIVFNNIVIEFIRSLTRER